MRTELKCVAICIFLLGFGLSSCKDESWSSQWEDEQYTDVYSDPAISPDGTKIAFVWNTREARLSGINVKAENGLWIIDRPTGEWRLLVEGYYVENPVFSNDGQKIAFFLDGRLATIGVDRDSLLTYNSNGYIDHITWSPDDSVLLYASMYMIGHYWLYYCPATSNGIIAKAFGIWYSSNLDPVWHKSSNKIYFNSITNQTNRWQFGYIEPSDSVFIVLDSLHSRPNMRITADSNVIVYSRSDEHGYGIWTCTLSNPAVSSKRLRSGGEPSVDSHGNEIVFIDTDPANRHFGVIWIMNIDGSNARPFTRAREFEEPK